MKKIILTVCICLISNMSWAGGYFCSADCGGVEMVLDINSEALVPVYTGGTAVGDGNTIGQAFKAMRADCKKILHEGFIVYNPGRLITLNTNVNPQTVCSQQ